MLLCILCVKHVRKVLYAALQSAPVRCKPTAVLGSTHLPGLASHEVALLGGADDVLLAQACHALQKVLVPALAQTEERLHVTLDGPAKGDLLDGPGPWHGGSQLLCGQKKGLKARLAAALATTSWPAVEQWMTLQTCGVLQRGSEVGHAAVLQPGMPASYPFHYVAME